MVCCVVLQENDLEQADKYAELAMSADRYNPAGNQNLTRTKTTLSHSHALSAHPLLVCLHLCLPVCLSLFPSHWSYYKNGSLICFSDSHHFSSGKQRQCVVRPGRLWEGQGVLQRGASEWFLMCGRIVQPR